MAVSGKRIALLEFNETVVEVSCLIVLLTWKRGWFWQSWFVALIFNSLIQWSHWKQSILWYSFNLICGFGWRRAQKTRKHETEMAQFDTFCLEWEIGCSDVINLLDPAAYVWLEMVKWAFDSILLRILGSSCSLLTFSEVPSNLVDRKLHLSLNAQLGVRHLNCN